MTQKHQTLADYVAIAIAPALIMALVGSLVFFLLEILYAGQYQGRLQWVLFLFVFSTVLIARMSMQGGLSERAPLYGLALGVAVWLALVKFVEYEGTPLAEIAWAVNLGLMVLIWWCAHKLTWDCTFIDDHVDASGAGLLESAGLDPDAPDAPADPVIAEPKGKRAKRGERKGLLGWADRYRRYREQRARQPHTPGVWVVYFSLAALPLFGLGQSLIPAGDEGRRRYAFWLMVIYVAGGLGLLLATSFLGLRRYLRQRNLQMPHAVTGLWLTLGAGLAVALLVAGALLPRPNAEYPVVSLSGAGSRERDASRFGAGGGSPGKGEGRPSGNRAGEEKGGEAAGGKAGSQQGQQGEGQSGKGQQSGGSQSGKGDNQSGDRSGEQSGRQGEQSQQGEPGQRNPSDRADGKGERQGQQQDKGDERRSEDSQSGGGKMQAPKFVQEITRPVTSLFSTLAKILKWVLFAVLAIAVAFIVFRAVLRFLANFTFWARGLLAAVEALWQRLFGWWLQPRRRAAAEPEAPPAEVARRRPFASYTNPFLYDDGRRSPEELVCYSFEALEAFAWEHDLGRPADETALQFAERLGDAVPSLQADARRLGALYARVAYGRGRLPGTAVEVVRKFWESLQAAVETPLSA